jgi:hypothetical protein
MVGAHGAATWSGMVPVVSGPHGAATWSGMVPSVVDTQGAARSTVDVVSSAADTHGAVFDLNVQLEEDDGVVEDEADDLAQAEELDGFEEEDEEADIIVDDEADGLVDEEEANAPGEDLY